MKNLFEVKIHNSDKFRTPALTYQQSGAYCFAPKGTLEYNRFWDLEMERCLNGYTAPDGDWISGYNYFYLNYCPIIVTKFKLVTLHNGEQIQRSYRVTEFPSFYDYDYYFFRLVQEAEDKGKHMCVLKSRRKGYSYKCGSMMARNYYLIPDSKSYAYASDSQYLDKDGILTKAWSYLDFIDNNTAWGKKRDMVDRALHKKASYQIKDQLGNKIEQGYKSEIIGVTISSDPDKVRGKAGKLILFEEAGKCEKPGTRIIMADGNIKVIEDIVIGDKVMGPDGLPRDVIGTQNGYDHMYDIIPNNGDIQTVNSKHLIYHKKEDWNGYKEYETITAQEYIDIADKSPKQSLYYSLVKTDKVEFEEKENIIDPYTFGLWLGDGTKNASHITTIDEAIKNYLFDYSKNNNLKFRIKYNKNSDAVSVCFSKMNNSNNWFLNELKRLNVYNNKHIPESYKLNSKENIRLFLAGLIDTDGYYDKRKNTYEIIQKSENIIDDAMFMARSLGIICTKSIKVINGTSYFRLYMRYNLTQIPVILERKKSREDNEFLRDPLSTRFKVKYNGFGKYYGITITGDNLYLHDDFTICHNCPELAAAWDIARPSVETDGKAFGLMIAFGTGGSDDSDFGTLKDMFYNPDSWNILGVENIWDEGVHDRKCGFFVPQYANDDTRDNDNRRLYMDNDGNTLKNEALKHQMILREPILEHATTTTQIDRYVAEHCITPQEACLELSGNAFPKKDLQNHLSSIRTNDKLKNFKQVGELTWTGEGNLKWENTGIGDITTYKIPKDKEGKTDYNYNRKGSIVIWEHPVQDPPYGLYIAGCLTPGEKVMTDIGLMNVEDVDHSRKLINKDGEIVSINTLLRYQKENESIYKVKMFNTFRTTTFTQEHPLYVSKAKYNSNKTINESLFDFKFERMRNVSIGDWVKVPNIYKKYKDISSNEFIQDSRFYYFLGLWLGDGWCDSRNRIYMSFNRSEKNLLNVYQDVVSELFNKNLSVRLRNNCYECSFSFKELSQYLNSNFGSGSDGKYIPEWVKYSSSEKKHALILGYLNTDGCISLNHKRKYNNMEFVSINLELLESIQDIGFSLGYISCLNKLRSKQLQIIENRIVNSKECYHLRFGNYDTLKFKSNFKKDVINNSKLKKIIYNKESNRCNKGCFLSNDTEYIYIQIKDIEHSKYTGIVYNFDCETHTFMCHHITTHNCDPYDHDSSTTDSLGSVFIFKRIQNFEEYYDLPVAEYTGRPNNSEEFYEIVRKLVTYYNATLLYENEKKGLFTYFKNKYCDYLLADQPDIKDAVTNSKVNRSKGIHMVEAIKDWGETLIRDWLNEEYAPGKKNLTKIFSEPLLEELISFNRKRGNYDRVMAFMMVMIYRTTLYNFNVKKNDDLEKKRSFLDFPLFKYE